MTSVDSKVMGFHGPGEGLVVIGLVFAILSIGSVMGRILSRVTVKRALGIDDYIMVASLVGYLSPCYLYARRILMLWCVC